MTHKPLNGIKVLDFTNVLAGPNCTMMLANMGAEIYKFERPGCGDDSRAYGPHINGESVYFLSVNRGKKSIACNTKTDEGRAAFLKIAAKAGEKKVKNHDCECTSFRHITDTFPKNFYFEVISRPE